MFKFVIVLIIYLALPANIISFDTPSDYELVFKSLGEISSSDFEKVCPGRYDNFLGVLDECQNCVENLSLKNTTICMRADTTFSICANPLRDFLTQCLPESSKDIADVMIAAQHGYLKDYICKLTIEQSWEFWSPCLLYSTSTNYDNCYDVFSERINEEFKLNRPPSSQFFFDAYRTFLVCRKEYINETCYNPITVGTIKGAVDAILKFIPKTT